MNIIVTPHSSHPQLPPRLISKFFFLQILRQMLLVAGPMIIIQYLVCHFILTPWVSKRRKKKERKRKKHNVLSYRHVLFSKFPNEQPNIFLSEINQFLIFNELFLSSSFFSEFSGREFINIIPTYVGVSL